MKTKTQKLVVSGIVFFPLIFASAVVDAQGKPDAVKYLNCGSINVYSNGCFEELKLLCDEIKYAGSLSSRDSDSMVSKSIGADIKIEQGKFYDADEKLYKIEMKLDSLAGARKSKISKKDLYDISGALMLTQSCVDDL